MASSNKVVNNTL